MLKILKMDALNPQPELLKEAAAVLRTGGLVIIPTDTVYGIAADGAEENALERLSAIKKRPKDKPFALLIAEKEKAEELAVDIPAAAYKLIDKFWPGPLTVVLKSRQGGTVGLRMPDHQVPLRLIGETGSALACPSANISGKPAPADFEEALEDFKEVVELAIDAGRTKSGRESSLVDLTLTPPQVLREGALEKEEIENTLKKKVILFVCTGNSCRSVIAKALLEKEVKEQKREDIEVLSAGIMMLGGLPASEGAKAVLAKEGLDVSAHRSQRITRLMLNKSDIILVMERLQEKRVLELAPEVKNRLFLLKEFANPVRNNNIAKISNGAKIKDNAQMDIEDPIGREELFYERTYQLIKEAVERISKII